MERVIMHLKKYWSVYAVAAALLIAVVPGCITDKHVEDACSNVTKRAVLGEIACEALPEDKQPTCFKALDKAVSSCAKFGAAGDPGE